MPPRDVVIRYDSQSLLNFLLKEIKMKRSALVVALIALSLTACGQKPAEAPAPAPVVAPAPAPAPASAVDAASAPAASAPAAAAAMAPAAEPAKK